MDNRLLTERLWELATAAFLLGALLVGLLLRRVHTTQVALRISQERLKMESERDSLTGAANRRHGQARLQAESDARTGAWRGAMLLVDVDHFKRVNDENGHTAGDEVLVEVARRLQATVRDDDVVLRWGGEEFLVLASNMRGAMLDKLAARLMNAVGATPVMLMGGRAIDVTVSIGYAAFPLAPHEQAVGWERALNLVDMALYTAKSQGRHRAVGVTRLDDDEAALADAERDFERACRTGRVQLAVEAGT